MCLLLLYVTFVYVSYVMQNSCYLLYLSRWPHVLETETEVLEVVALWIKLFHTNNTIHIDRLINMDTNSATV